MKFGLGGAIPHEDINPAAFAREAAQRGLSSLFLGDHPAVPASPIDQDRPAEVDGERYLFYDPFVALAAYAVAAPELQVGTSVCLVCERETLATAKAVATLDRVSDGRFIFGIGAGWDEAELELFGVNPRTRFGLMKEKVEAMKEIWTSPVAEYHGKFVDFGPTDPSPTPVQRPHPPVYVGGVGPKVLERVVSYGDGWIPTASPDADADIARIEELQRLAAEAGREPIPVIVAFMEWPEPALIERYEAAGVEQVFSLLLKFDPDELGRKLDDFTAIVRDYAGTPG